MELRISLFNANKNSSYLARVLIFILVFGNIWTFKIIYYIIILNNCSVNICSILKNLWEWVIWKVKLLLLVPDLQA